MKIIIAQTITTDAWFPLPCDDRELRRGIEIQAGTEVEINDDRAPQSSKDLGGFISMTILRGSMEGVMFIPESDMELKIQTPDSTDWYPKLCPKCNGMPIVTPVGSMFAIRCQHADTCMGYGPEKPSKFEAVDAWNKWDY